MVYMTHFQSLIAPTHNLPEWEYIPIDFAPMDNAAELRDHSVLIRDAQLYHFGVLSSAMCMAWVKSHEAGAERQNAFKMMPWPLRYTEAQLKQIETAAQGVQAVRAQFLNRPLARLYDATLMPVSLRAAHANLDKAVDAAYRERPFNSMTERLAFLAGFHDQIDAWLSSGHDVDETENYRLLDMPARQVVW